MQTDLFGLVGQTFDGKYDVEEAVAEGGFGVVYRALHRTLNRPVAIKVLKCPPELSDKARVSFMESFAREAQTIAHLDHPAIVKVLDFGVAEMPIGGPAPWMVLEWLKGRTLDKDLSERRGRGGRSPSECLAILRPVMQGVACAHDDRIAHRDIKPANIILMSGRVGDTGEPRANTGRRGESVSRLLDFGIAKIMSPEEVGASGHTRTQAQFLTFSLPYAAPEQLSATRTGPWTDVHALALVLTEMLTDTTPYVGAEVLELHMDVLSPLRPTPGKFGFDVGPWEPILARAAASRPSDRFANAGEFLAALEADVPAQVIYRGRGGVSLPAPAPIGQTLIGGPVSTLTPTTSPHARGSSRPRNVLLGAAALLSLVAVGGLLSVAGSTAAAPSAPPRAATEPVVLAPAIARPTAPPVLVAPVRPVAPPIAVLVDAGAVRLVVRPVVAVAPPASVARSASGHGHVSPMGMPPMHSLAPAAPPPSAPPPPPHAPIAIE